MANYWKQPGVPHKGWILVDVIDVLEDSQQDLEAIYESCMMCGKEKVRFIHIVEHPGVEFKYKVGCTCAEKMTNDYVNPKKREKELRNKVNRRSNWIEKKWEKNKNGNYFLKIGVHHLLIYVDTKTQKYRVKIGKIFGKKTFDTLLEAKIAAFYGIEYLKKNGRW